MNLATIDVNLLVALDVLLQERHVTKAAQRMGVTQSAMSQILQRLRALFDDPLLVRQGTSMVTSPRAESLAGPLRAALRSLEATLSATPGFDPATASNVFRLAAFDVYALSLVPRLVSSLAREAPGTHLVVMPVDMDRVFERQRDGEIDVALLVPRELPSDIRGEPLIEETMVAMVRRDHPVLAHDPPPLEEVVRWPHLTVSITGRGRTSIDEEIEARGQSRRIGARVAYFLAAPGIVCQSDLVATVPITAAREFARRWPVALFPYPTGPMPYTVRMTWTRALDADPAQAWFRERVREVAGTLLEDEPPITKGSAPTAPPRP